MNIEEKIRTYDDFPKKGIKFKDIFPLRQDPIYWDYIIKSLCRRFRDCKPELILGIESRGFILGSSLATSMNVGFIPIRKAGKLPGEKYTQKYTLEYGEAILEIQKDIIP